MPSTTTAAIDAEGDIGTFDDPWPLFVTVVQAAKLTGIPLGTLEKSFCPKRPKYAPPPPPHFREGRRIYVFKEALREWARSLCGLGQPVSPHIILNTPRSPGRPTKAAQIARAQAMAALEAQKRREAA